MPFGLVEGFLSGYGPPVRCHGPPSFAGASEPFGRDHLFDDFRLVVIHEVRVALNHRERLVPCAMAKILYEKLLSRLSR